MKIPKRYIPERLTKKDKIKQKQMISKSKKLYKKKKYYSRKKLNSFKSKRSKHILNVEKKYNIKTMKLNANLAKKTKCKLSSLKKIVNKGMGAYYSSGSRPNQTAASWGLARLASSITGGKSSAVDFKILKEGCNKQSKALKLAKKNQRKYKHGLRKVPKFKMSGGTKHMMNEEIIRMSKGPKFKKYTAYIKNNKTKKNTKNSFWG